MKAEELDRRFDDGEDVLEFFDVANLKRPGLAKRPVNIDLPQWMLDALEKEAQGLGVAGSLGIGVIDLILYFKRS